jgi:hypothetical protein
MNLSGLRSAVRNRIGVPATDSLFTDPVVNEIVNHALHAIEAEWDWPWLEATENIPTAAGTASYAPLSTSWLRTLELQYGDYPPLERWDIARLRAMGVPAGRPNYFAVYADQLQLRPVPTAVLTLTHLFIKRENDLAADADTPLMPATYHWALVEYAAYLCYRRSNRLDAAGGALAAYTAWRDKWVKQNPSRYSEDVGGGDTPMPTDAAQPLKAVATK